MQILCTIRSAVNESRPINRLPLELFEKVIEGRESERDLVAATQVCRRWRSILISTTKLWTNVDFEHPSRASVYLDRSKTTPVDITIGKTRDCVVGAVGALIGSIPWVSRMKSLRIETDMDQIKSIAEKLRHAAPELQSLTFEGKRRPYSYTSYGQVQGGAIFVPYDFLGRHAPKLESMTFHTVSPSVVFTFPLPRLTHIDWVADQAHVVIEELLNLFVSSPLLEVVKVHALIRRTQTYKPLIDVTLNKLRKFDWADCDGSLSPLPSLTAPELRDLAIKVTRHPQYQQTNLSTVLPRNASQFPLLLEPKIVKYTCEQGVRSFQLGYDGVSFLSVREVSKERNANYEIRNWFSQPTPLSFGTTLSLAIEATGGRLLPGDVPIEQFVSLETLELIGETAGFVPLIKLDRGMSGNLSLVPCPDLKEIRIVPKENLFNLDQLAQVLGERRKAGYRGVKTVRLMGKYKYLLSEIRELREVVDQVIT